VRRRVVLLLLVSVGPAEPRLVHCSLSRLIVLTPLLVPPSSPEALHIRRRERLLLAKGGITGEKWPVKVSRNNTTSTSLSGSLIQEQGIALQSAHTLVHLCDCVTVMETSGRSVTFKLTFLSCHCPVTVTNKTENINNVNFVLL
jgi:hypothetical protein